MASTPDPTTTEWVPLWDLNGLALSAVPPHHVTHDTGGSDAITSLSGVVITSGTILDARLSVNVLKFAGGYPGGTATFLRADGTFSPPTVPGPPSPHAATHEPGGSDVLFNNAWLNTSNIFTQEQTINKTNPALNLNDPSQPADGKNWRIITAAGIFYFQALNDAAAAVGTVTISRVGVLYAPAGLDGTPLNASNLTSGTVPAARLTNVAVLNVANVFTQNQRVTGTRPMWEMQATGNPVISRIGQVVANNRIDITSNLSYDGANWNSDDTSQASALYFQQQGLHYFYTAPPGPNPRSSALIQEAYFNTDGTLTVHAGLVGTPLNASSITSGTVPIANLPANVARTDIDNRFVPQSISSYSNILGPNSLLGFTDTASPVDKKYWRLVNYTDGNMWMEALNDAQNAYQARFGFVRDGNFYAAGLDASALNRGTVPPERLPSVGSNQTSGYFLPVIGGDQGEVNQIYKYQQGYWIKTGKIVTVWAYTQFLGNPDGSTNGNEGTIYGTICLKLPFVTANPANNPANNQAPPDMVVSVGYYSNQYTPQDLTGMAGRLFRGTNFAQLLRFRSAGQNPVPMHNGDVNSASQFVIQCTYYVD